MAIGNEIFSTSFQNCLGPDSVMITIVGNGCHEIGLFDSDSFDFHDSLENFREIVTMVIHSVHRNNDGKELLFGQLMDLFKSKNPVRLEI